MKRRDAGWVPEKVTAEKTVTLAACLVLVFGQVQVSAQSTLPTGGSVVAGQVDFGAPSNGAMTINQSSANAIVNWESFSVGGANSVAFQNGAGATLNRVTGATISRIDGSLTATGSLFLVNENGMIVGPTGRIETGGRFVGSTRDITNEDFLDGGANRFSGTGAGDIENHGTITSLNDDVVLIARNVTNAGEINASNGTAALGAGSEILLQDTATADGLMYVRLAAADASVTHEGVVNAASAELRAHGGNIYTLAGNRSGEINATGSANVDGRIFLTAEGGNAQVDSNLSARSGDAGGDIHVSSTGLTFLTGDLDASGDASGGQVQVEGRSTYLAGEVSASSRNGAGGTLQVTAENRVVAMQSASLEANGATQGGEIQVAGGRDGGDGVFSSGTMSATSDAGVGGEVRVTGADIDLVAGQIDVSGATGGGTVALGFEGTREAPDIIARTVDVSAYTDIRADAIHSGTGGEIAVWSTEKTAFFGNSFLRGGAQGGDGGFAEVSSLNTIRYGGVADASAVNGTAGSLLLDPKNLTVDVAADVIPLFEIVDPNPSDNNEFANVALETGKGTLVVTSYQDDAGATDAGAVYLFNSTTGALISTLTGSQNSDRVGRGGARILTNGNYVVTSRFWSNGSATSAGAATWGSGITGVSGVVSAANSLVGSQANDNVGFNGVTALTNGNYVVGSSLWNNGSVPYAGAVTWGNGAIGTVGVVSSSNSLVGSRSDDGVGSGGITTLTNGNYVVKSSQWDNGSASDAGAVTWGNGATGTVGAVSVANSLVGSRNSDYVGSSVTALTNGNYVVGSYFWGDGSFTSVGAATWGDGATGTSGVVSAANSLVGSQALDRVGFRVSALTNGNYVVGSPLWSNGSVLAVGAVTWGNGATGTVGTVSTGNSLVGSQSVDLVGLNGVTALTNGNYVVSSSRWDNGSVSDAGAATWGNGATGTVGTVSTANSLVGSQANDYVGVAGAVALTNGNYVVNSYQWANGRASQAGAVTWGDGATGTVGVVSAANSLVGGQTNDNVGSYGVTALTNGNYVVSSIDWDNGSVVNAGAATWGNGASGTSGLVSVSNSLVGSQTSDNVGFFVTPLTNGNYVVVSSSWANGSVSSAGAVTWGDGTTGTSGLVSATNSLVGSQSGDNIGGGGNNVFALADGGYVVRSTSWDNGSTSDVGALTFGQSDGSTIGPISAANSILGTQSGSGWRLAFGATDSYGLVRSIDGARAKLYLSPTDPNAVDFGNFVGQDVSVRPDFLTRTLNTGTNVKIQANNNITINSPILVNNPTGDGGSFSVDAGNSIFVNANITTDNGDLRLFANGDGEYDLAAQEVVRADRDAGAATITFADGVTIDAGTGGALFVLFAGNGAANTVAGDIVFTGNNTVAGSTVTVGNLGDDTSTHEVRLGAGTQFTASGNDAAAPNPNTGAILITSDVFTNNAGAGAFNFTGGGRFVVYSSDYDVITRGGLVGRDLYNTPLFASPGVVSQILEAGNHFVFERQPPLTVTNNGNSGAGGGNGTLEPVRDPGVIRVVEVADTGNGLGGTLEPIFRNGFGGGAAAFRDLVNERRGIAGMGEGGAGDGREIVAVDLGLAGDREGSGESFGFQLPFNFAGCTDASACAGVPDSVFGSSFVMTN